MSVLRIGILLSMLLLAACPATRVGAQTASTAASVSPDTSAPAPPPSPVRGVRFKISAADLLSAESILEVHRLQHGEDGQWLVGYAWLARGAHMLGDDAKAERYAAGVYAACVERVENGAVLDEDGDLEYALGAVIEVEAQRIERHQGVAAAAEYVRGEQARWQGPVGFRSRLQKRINLMALEGSPAPELAVEETVAGPVPSLASLAGKPVVLFLWNRRCGDCLAQAAALAAVRQRYRDEGVQWIALTRHYEEGDLRLAENARVDSVWKSAYADVGPAPIVVSEASMVRYGGSSTPTFVFIDRKGTVRGYTPTRLTEGELDNAVRELLR